MAPYNEETMARAISDITRNNISTRTASFKYAIPRSTIYHRLHGRPPTGAPQSAQILTCEQEERLAKWIVHQDLVGHAPSHSAVRLIAKNLANLEELPGKNWPKAFTRRNPSVHTKIGRKVEAIRFNNFNPKAVKWYFDVRQGEYGWIRPELTFNVDEGGIMAGYGKKATFFLYI